MLKIRKEQMDALKAEADRTFAEEVAAHVRQNHAEAVVRLPGKPETPVSGLPDELLADLAASGISRARSHGLTWEYSITAFVALMFEIAPNFDRQDRIRALLRDDSVAPDSRIDLLRDKATDEDWEQAEKLYDPQAWGERQ